MKRVVQIDTRRRWSELLRGHAVIDISKNPSPQRITESGLTKDVLLILHITDFTAGDKTELDRLNAYQRPRVVLVTGDPQNKLPAATRDWAAGYVASIVDNVPHFQNAESLAENMRASYTAHLHQMLGEVPQAPKENLVEQVEGAAIVRDCVEALVSVLRFWIDAKLHLLPFLTTRGGSSLGLQSIAQIATPKEWEVLLLPGQNGAGWGDVFSGSLLPAIKLRRWLRESGSGARAIECILSPQASFQAAKKRAISQSPMIEEGGAIRLLFEIALVHGDLTTLSSNWSEPGLALQSWSLESWACVFRAAMNEAETLSLQIARAAARAEFTCAELIPNEDERSLLHHNAFRQEVLQRLISSDVPGQLSARFEDNILPSRLTQLAKLLAEGDQTTFSANVKSAFAAWRGDPERCIKGVKARLAEVFRVWRNQDWLARAGMALKSDQAKHLDDAAKAIDLIDAVIGSEQNWQQHLASAQAKRIDQAAHFWTAASMLLEILGGWHAAPTRIFEFYEEI